MFTLPLWVGYGLQSFSGQSGSLAVPFARIFLPLVSFLLVPVAIGVALDTRYSVLSGRLAAGEDERVADLLERLGFVLWHDKLRQRDSQGRALLLKGLADFREHLGGELTVTLLAGIGRGVEVHEMDEKMVGQSIDWLEQRK